MRITPLEQPDTIKAIFISELSNRFKCLVDIEGIETLCYVPSSCRLSNFIDLTGHTVLLTRLSSQSRIEYSLYAVETDKGLVLLNLALANKIVLSQINKRCFAFLGKRKQLRTELVVNGDKRDLDIEETKTIIEIKTILSLDSSGHFPTVYPHRLINQLRKIEALLESGFRVCYLFIALGPQIKRIYLDANQEFSELFDRCRSKGMICRGYTICIHDDGISVLSKVKLMKDNQTIIE